MYKTKKLQQEEQGKHNQGHKDNKELIHTRKLICEEVTAQQPKKRQFRKLESEICEKQK